MKRQTLTLCGSVLLYACVALEPPTKADPGPRNVLLICIDDLRPELGCYGEEHVRSPRIDAFATGAVRFDRHYAAFPTCGASRFAFLTGRRPSAPQHYGNGAFKTLQNEGEAGPLPMPNAFRAAGYRTICLGKLSHSHNGLNGKGEQELPGAWDATPTDPGPWREARHLLHGYANGRARQAGKSSISEAADVPDEGYPDARLASQAIEQLRELADSEEPFFLGVGFFKPHLPFAAPKRYWDLYDPLALPLAADGEKPQDMPRVNGWAQSGEVTGNYAGAGYDDKVWSEAERRHLRHGYLACVSYVDEQVGRVLAELSELGLDDDTIVVLWGDHGWHLGDQGLFGKHTTFEAALRSTLLVRAPGMASGGTGTSALVESIDIYPTLAELCGVSFPAELSGRSFTALLTNPAGEHRSQALSYWRRGGWHAESVRTDTRRTVSWTRVSDGERAELETYEIPSLRH